jgi:hypothetical protein
MVKVVALVHSKAVPFHRSIHSGSWREVNTLVSSGL